MQLFDHHVSVVFALFHGKATLLSSNTSLFAMLGLRDQFYENTNLLLTERKACTGKYWPAVIFVRNSRSIRSKTTEGQDTPYGSSKLG